ncbi:PQQ-binding-like beta-propeller repeat protein [Natrinema marinum]|uniref:outer membrane protein assembly factor BamB family protein n=1 Tax=Natrinema marinum TaxID=2961598 RepID=UPI0020C8A8B1|nr:PQQ-binding-like beta-propeller repeat protein [Natrinema marinum]
MNDDESFEFNPNAERFRWRYRTDGIVPSSPALDAGKLYIGSADGYLRALNAPDGTLQWRFNTGDWVVSDPVVVDETVYFGSWDTNLYAVSIGGTEEWRFPTDDTLVPQRFRTEQYISAVQIPDSTP